MSFVRRNWRDQVLDYAQSRRLELTACPVSFEVVLVTAGARNEELRKWVRENLGSGVMLRTAQAERIADGASLREAARMTGVSERYVLYTLTRLEEEDREVGEFYARNGQELEAG